MFPAKTQEGSRKTVTADQHSPIASQALEWVWRFLQDVSKPHILDCGAVSAASVRVFAQRGAKVYVADLLAPLQQGHAVYWRREEKKLTFCLDEFLKRVPGISPASLQLICCWHLFDFIPREQLPGLLNFLLGLLGNEGILYCFLREPNLKTGKNGRWWLEGLTTLGSEGEEQGEFPYPPLSNREVEKLTEGYSLKTFLTRSHRREVVVLKRGDL
jgi:hypothetical protein